MSKFCTEYGSNTAMLYAKFWNDFITKMAAMDAIHPTEKGPLDFLLQSQYTAGSAGIAALSPTSV